MALKRTRPVASFSSSRWGVPAHLQTVLQHGVHYPPHYPVGQVANRRALHIRLVGVRTVPEEDALIVCAIHPSSCALSTPHRVHYPPFIVCAIHPTG